jgi:hypothetical protein
MANFNATNSTNLKNLFIDRILYEALFSLPEDFSDLFPIVKGVKDYWSLENLLYGKVDRSFEPIRVLKSSLVSVSQGGEDVFLLPEVGKAFKKMQNLFLQRYRAGNLAEDPYLNDIKIFKAYRDADSDYNSYITDIITKFNDQIISSQKENEIIDIKFYFNKLFVHIMESPEIEYVSRASFYMSSNVSALSSGMSLEVSDLNPSRNEDKQLFLDSLNFEFYREAAINFGFIIDKNIPWRLNFDLSSPVNKKELGIAASGESLASVYLSTRFAKLVPTDIDYLISSMLLGYNTFVERKPIRREGICFFRREKYGLGEVTDEIFSRAYFLDKYINIKNKENNTVYSSSEIDKIIFNAVDLTESASLNYIESKFNLPYYFEGSTTYTLIKRELAKNKNFPLDNFNKHVKLLIKKKIEGIY